MPGRLALVLAGLLWTAAAASADSILYLRPAAALPPGDLTLGAIADVRGADPREAAALASLILGPVPARASYLPPLEVRRRVERAWSGRVDLVGAGVVMLPVAVVPERQRPQAAALLSALASARTVPGWLEVDLLSPLPESAGEAVLLTGVPAGEPLAGRMQVGVGESSVLLFVHPFAEVARAARDLPSGLLLAPGDVEFVEQDLAGLRGGFLTASEFRVPYRVAVPIPRGALLEPSRLARNLLVKAGERVIVVFWRPGLSLTLSGKAWSSGAPGETVEVSLRDPMRRFRGKVTDTGEVVVERL